MSRHILLLALASCSLAVAAGNANAADIRSSPTVVDKLLNQGTTKVGSLDLVQLRDRMKEVEFREGDPAALRAEYKDKVEVLDSVERPTGFYVAIPGERKVVVDPAVANENSEQLPALKFHEGFGALGYRDHRYQVTTTLHVLEQLPDGARKKFFEEKYFKEMLKEEKSYQHLNAKKYDKFKGGTSVGGGGDLKALALKLAVASYLVELSETELSFFINLAETNFETTKIKGSKIIPIIDGQGLAILIPEKAYGTELLVETTAHMLMYHFAKNSSMKLMPWLYATKPGSSRVPDFISVSVPAYRFNDPELECYASYSRQCLYHWFLFVSPRAQYKGQSAEPSCKPLQLPRHCSEQPRQ